MTDPKEVNTLRNELKKVLDRIESDSSYRQQLVNSPSKALAAVMDTQSKDAPKLLANVDVKPTGCKGNITCKITCLYTCGPKFKTCGGSNKKIFEES